MSLRSELELLSALLKIYDNIYEKSESKDQNMNAYSRMQIVYAPTQTTLYMLITGSITKCNVQFPRASEYLNLCSTGQRVAILHNKDASDEKKTVITSHVL